MFNFFRRNLTPSPEKICLEIDAEAASYLGQKLLEEERELKADQLSYEAIRQHRARLLAKHAFYLARIAADTERAADLYHQIAASSAFDPAITPALQHPTSGLEALSEAVTAHYTDEAVHHDQTQTAPVANLPAAPRRHSRPNVQQTRPYDSKKGLAAALAAHTVAAAMPAPVPAPSPTTPTRPTSTDKAMVKLADLKEAARAMGLVSTSETKDTP